MVRKDKDCSADFHRAKREERKKREQEQNEQKEKKPVDIKPGPTKIPEGPDHAKKRSEHFRKSRGL